MGWLNRLDRLIAGVIATAQWFALPLILLLFLQWPLRDLLRAYSTQANDLGQIFFALFVSVSISAATRSGTHLAADTLAQSYRPRTRAWIKRLGGGFALLPWAVFVFVAGKAFVVPSVLEGESFPETNNPGYFIIKCCLWSMAATMIAQAVVDIARPIPRDDT
jgi:TRAP-type mannitol/chloroaromatic compound transport system permease small subunit